MMIQQLGPDEVDRFRAIRMRGLAEAPAAFGTTLGEARRWTPERWSVLFSGLLAFVAVEDDEDVGLVRAAPDLEVESAARLGSLWVAPSARGRGIGSRLVHTVVAWARSGGFDELLLDVSDDNEAAAALYDAIGFVRTGKTSAFPPPRECLSRHQRRLRL